MAPRQTARRLLVAAPALALALAVTACTPPNEEPASPDAPYTLPTYSEEPKATETEAPAGESTTAEATTTVEDGMGEPAGDAGGDAGIDGTGDEATPIPGQEQPAEGQVAPGQPAP